MSSCRSNGNQQAASHELCERSQAVFDQALDRSPTRRRGQLKCLTKGPAPVEVEQDWDRHGRHWKYLRGVAITSAGDEQTVPRALPVSEAEIEETRSWIENANPSLSQIEARAAAAPSQ